MKASNIAIGTVQFGLDYGITNKRGKTDQSAARSILDLANHAGVTTLDTAALYGNAEETLGAIRAADAFEIVTKTVHLHTDVADVMQAFDRSLKRLCAESVYGLLVHRASDLLGPQGDTLWRALSDAKRAGLVQKIGASIYDTAELDAVRARCDVDIVQLPCSVFDQRMVSTIAELEEQGVEVHVRSVFLQGLVFMRPDDAPDSFEPVQAKLRAFHAAADGNPLAAAIAFAEQLGASKLVLGFEDAEQLSALLQTDSTISAPWEEFDFGDHPMAQPKNW